MKIDRGNLHHWGLLFRQGLYTLLAIASRPFTPRAGKPLVLLYGHQFSGNLKALYEEWQQHGPNAIELAYITLDPDQLAELRSRSINVLACYRWRDMRNLSRCSAMITDHGLHAMLPLVHLTNIRFVDVWHGIPFKGFTPENFKLQRCYDEIWVSSPLLKSLYVERFGFSPEKVHCLGYARTDKLFRRPRPSSVFRKKAGIPPDRKLVLYAPTWRQDEAGRELFPFGTSQAEFIDTLASTCASAGAILVIRSHLNARINSDSVIDTIYCSQKEYADTEDLLLGTDILICDWSSIAFDFLALERPTLFLDVPAPFRHGYSLGPDYRFGCVIADIEALKRKLHEYLVSPDTYFQQYTASHRQITREVYEDSSGTNAAQRQLQRLEELIARPSNNAQ